MLFSSVLCNLSCNSFFSSLFCFAFCNNSSSLSLCSSLGSFCLSLLGELGSTSSLGGSLSLTLCLLSGFSSLDSSSALCLLSSLASSNSLGSSTELVSKALYTSARVDQLLLAREERMASVADVNADLRLRGRCCRRCRLPCSQRTRDGYLFSLVLLTMPWFPTKAR